MIVSKLSIFWNPIWQYLIIHVILVFPCFNILTLVKQTINKQKPTEWKFVGNYYKSVGFYVKKNNKKKGKLLKNYKNVYEQIRVNCLPNQQTQIWQCKRKWKAKTKSEVTK